MDTEPDSPPVQVRVAPGVQVNAGGLVLRDGEAVAIRDPDTLARWLRLGWVVEQ
jgi:hypothetical protein